MKARKHTNWQRSLRSFAPGLTCAALMSASPMLAAKPTWAPGPSDVIMSPGITAATCSGQKRDGVGNPVSASDAYVFGMMDLRAPSAPDYTTLGGSATMWSAPMWHDSTWTAKDMGCVFGIAIDPQGNTYTAANGLWEPVYGTAWFGDPYLRYGDIGRAGSDELGASGTIYKIDALTGVASVFVRVPQVSDPNLPIVPGTGTTKGGPGLGNITVDYSSGNLFATSLDDGKIYQYSPSGSSLGTFDPFTVEASPTPGMIPLGERLWAIEAHAGKLYFSVWNGGTASNRNEIWSVNLPGGVIDGGSLAMEFQVPASYGANSSDSITVSDLSFSSDGNTMLIGERSLRNYGANGALADHYAPHNHTTSGRKAEFISGAWVLTGDVATGNNASQGEAYGGIEFGFEAGAPEAVVWLSSADIATGAGPHGLQGMRMTDFPAPAGPPSKVTDSYVVPYVPGTGPSGPDFKGMGGDLDTMKEGECARIVVRRVNCPKEPGGPFTVTLNVTNLGPKPASIFNVVPTPAGSLPGGAIGVQPTPTGWQPLPSVLNTGDSANITLTLPGLSGGEFACFNLTLLDSKFEECCTETVCVDIPKCECAIVHGVEVKCRQLADGTWVYDLSVTVENTSHLIGSPLSAYGISFGPDVAAFSPNYLDISGSPLNPGDTRTFNTTYSGPSGVMCFKLALHSEGNEECCILEKVCVDLPPCGDDDPTVADCCRLTPELTYCCPLEGEGLLASEGARVRYTICNKSRVERTYEWKIENMGPGFVSFAQVDPVTGAVTEITGGVIGPVPPGRCQTIEIIIICNMPYGECADYVITSSAGAGSPSLVCRGRICRPKPDATVIKAASDDPVELGVGEVRAYEYIVSNPSDVPADIPVSIVSSYGIIGISLSPDKPGFSALETTVRVPAGSEEKLVVYLSQIPVRGVVPAHFVRLRAKVGDLLSDPADAHVSVITLLSGDDGALPFSVIDLGDNQGFIKLDLFLQKGPMEMAVEEFNLTTKSWERIPVGVTADGSANQGSVLLSSGLQVVYSPRANQSRGIFRVICIE
ncbi:hypothetical protein V2O64_10770 [Verrucomicrobiaceae bacterium 227]